VRGLGTPTFRRNILSQASGERVKTICFSVTLTGYLPRSLNGVTPHKNNIDIMDLVKTLEKDVHQKDRFSDLEKLRLSNRL
jgi:hypothetical protein